MRLLELEKNSKLFNFDIDNCSKVNLHERIIRVDYIQKWNYIIMENSNQSWEEIQGLSWIFFDE